MATKPTNKPSKPEKKSKKPNAQRYLAKSLGLDRRTLPHSIVDVVGVLQRAGFEAYIVGGGVRDSLLGLAPKDFDAVTNARPHEIKAIFGGRCRIIGRRFQLAHVYSGREMIEVATFRAPPKDDTHTTEEGMITRDNVWGTIEQDFARRDFSINALYYNPIKGEVLDFCGAIDDIKTKTLRLLGDAKVRIEEDPVRLLRALRFKAKLGFEFDKALAKQFCQDNWSLLEQVSTHRLYDETQKMFNGGYLAPLLPLLFDYGAMGSLMNHAPSVPTALMTAVATNTDKRVAQDLGTNPAFVYAVLLWENYLHALAKFKKQGVPFHDAQIKAGRKVFDAQKFKTAIPRFAEDFITSIWLLQPKLVNPRPREIANLATHVKFRPALDFLLMRECFDECLLSEPTNNMGAWWQDYQSASSHDKAVMVQNLGHDKGVPRRRRQRGSDLADVVLDDKPKIKEPVKTAPIADSAVQIPIFEQITYSESDFLKLLANDEPYIPSQRYRKREPSSTLSLKERQEQDLMDDVLDDKADKTAKPKKQKSVKSDQKSNKPKKDKKSKADKSKTNKPKDKVSKPKKRKKSNAKPRANHD